ncbi:MAG: polysaccharide biosynthesis tyrosine autokinase, partial [Methylocapsa sp.]|nr:polysaccharide biosynthesis tyrosine autokinase [Methylocapsa sp.]
MLQINKQFASGDASKGIWGPANAESGGKFNEIIAHQLPVIIGTIVAITALGFLYLLFATPTFLATASVVLDLRKAQTFEQQQAPAHEDNMVDSGMVQTQIEILKSAEIAHAIVDKFQLTKDPEFVGPPTGIKRVISAITSAIFGSRELTEAEKASVAADSLQDKCTISRVGQTYVIDVGVELRDPQKAARIANAMVDFYLNDELEAKYAAARRATVWLQKRAHELQAQMTVASQAVADFKKEHNIITVAPLGSDRRSRHDEGLLMNEKEVSDLNTQLVLAQAQTADAKARYDRIQEIMKQDVPDASVAEALKNEVIIKLRQQYLDLATREAMWSQRYGANHLAAVQTRNQMREISRSIKDEMQKIEESAKSDYEIAQTREQTIKDGLSKVVSQSQVTNQARVRLQDLESAAETAQAIYEDFLQRQMTAVQAQSFPIPEARLIDPAEPPLLKTHPKAWLVLLLTATAGIVVSYSAAYLRELYDRVFRSSAQIEEALELKCLAMVPDLRHSEELDAAAGKPIAFLPSRIARRLPPWLARWLSELPGIWRTITRYLLAKWQRLIAGPQPRRVTEVSGPRTPPQRPAAIARPPLLFNHVLDEPFSQFTESLRSIKIASDLAARQDPVKVFGVTSILPHEGKSTIAANYAQLIAQCGFDTVLIDADFRNPTLSRQFISKSPGLSEVISGQLELQKVLLADRRTGLKVVPSGLRSKLLNTNELLASAGMRNIAAGLRETCDYIVVDLPPLVPVVDARAAINFIDAYILVIEWGRTRIDAARRSLANAPEIYERVLGV